MMACVIYKLCHCLAQITIFNLTKTHRDIWTKISFNRKGKFLDKMLVSFIVHSESLFVLSKHIFSASFAQNLWQVALLKSS